MKLTKTPRIADEDTEPRPHVARRRFIGVVGGGGLTTAAMVFGFAPPASARTVPYGCCHLCCRPRNTVAACENGFHYVWRCSGNGKTCTCCEHKSPCTYGCSSVHYSSVRCT